ncbi:MAG: hypothetical protein AAFW69_08020, partial [Pseudomonadota bacterium]
MTLQELLDLAWDDATAPQRIAALDPAATATPEVILDGTELLPVVQDDVLVRTTVAELRGATRLVDLTDFDGTGGEAGDAVTLLDDGSFGLATPAGGGGGGALEFVEEIVVTSVPEIDIALDGAGPYEIRIDRITPAQSDVDLFANLTDDGFATVEETGYLYARARVTHDDPDVTVLGGGSGTSIPVMTFGEGNGASHFSAVKLEIFGHDDAGLATLVEMNAVRTDSDGHPHRDVGVARYTPASAVDGIRLAYSSGDIAAATIRVYRRALGAPGPATPADPALPPLIVAAGDETTAIEVAQAVTTFRAPKAMTLTGLRASLTTASSAGDVTVDLRVAGVSILSAPITIPAGATTSVGAPAQPVIASAAIADDAEIKIDVTAAGTDAAGLKVTMMAEAA